MAELHIGLIITVSDEDDPEDTLEDIQESIGILMLDHPEWQPANVHIASSPDAGGDGARLREALHDLLRYSLSEDETRLMLVVTGGSRAVDGSEPGLSLHERCDRIGKARERARAALAAEQRPAGGEAQPTEEIRGRVYCPPSCRAQHR